ncbi:N-acetylglucosamine-6-phosphate deacetylase [Sediminibacterium soli]|uniref:N-acetylglucosamine-6-phosphate deacetylase n=1 Tax=Sediminibacterium soli TaxID=2698829 RepID=UPI0013796DEE|nr:N-acetylglucosamine-6-phosphate deacetylase [Sediminibacterium soli]NCI47849.1 N-acetylglucosamine-6-phosphate deacetylase [Sediminibacterium soli]
MKNDNQRVYQAANLFTGDRWLKNHSLAVGNGKVTELFPSKTAGAADAYLIAPVFMDIQLYGAYGKLLSVYPQADTLHKMYDYCAKGGAPYFQPTVATNDTAVFHRCIDAVRVYRKEGGRGCIGLHVEGPWISDAKKGAHLSQFIHVPSVSEARELLEYGKEVITMITLAPEVCSKEVIALVQSYGVAVSAGHSNASYEAATAAFDEGITAATHLFNAMSPLQHRAPGMVGAIFDHATVKSSIVPDGYHVDFSMIRVAKKIMGERLFAITDAVTDTTEGPYPHRLAGDKYEANGILSGSALTMASSLRNLVNRVGIPVDEALRMVSLYPAQVMHLSDRLGKLEPGYEAGFVVLDQSLEVVELITGW